MSSAKHAEMSRADSECAEKEAKEATLGATKAELDKTAVDLNGRITALADVEAALEMANTAIGKQDAKLQETAAQVEQLTSMCRVATENEYAMSQELTSASMRADAVEGMISTLTADLQAARSNVAELNAELRSTHTSEDKLLKLTADSHTGEQKVLEDMRKLQADLATACDEKALVEAGLSEAIASLAASGSEGRGEQLEHAQKEIASLRDQLNAATAGNDQSIGGVGLTSTEPQELVRLKADLEYEKKAASIAKGMLSKLEAEKRQLSQDVQDAKLQAWGDASRRVSSVDGGRDGLLSSDDSTASQERKVRCERLEVDMAAATNKLVEKNAELQTHRQELRTATSKIKELEKIITMQAAARQSLEELLIEQSEESDALRADVAAGRVVAGEAVSVSQEEFRSLQRRAVECEQLLSLGIFERQTLQEKVAAVEREAASNRMEHALN